MIQFERPKDQSSIIKVIGVGGGGGNAVNYMYGLGVEGIDFVVCNTDSQALTQSPIPNKIQLGPNLTQGLGAGANPEIGKQAGEESIEEITKILKVRTKMAFITAGMGGGTGTGAAPIIAKVCKDLDILTIGIVTTPFTYEGRTRLRQAQDGIDTMREYVDTILIISNDKLRQQFGNLPFSQAFSKADDILATAARCITDLITQDGRVNLDFNDVQTVMKKGGVAILGSAQAEGEDRAKKAVVEALNSPLLNDSEIEGAKWILLNITSAAGDYEHTLDELEIIQSYVQERAGNTCDIILGMGHNPGLDDKIAVTIIATGFQQNEIKSDMPPAKGTEKIIIPLAQADEKSIEQAQSNQNKTDTSRTDPMSPRLVEDRQQENSRNRQETPEAEQKPPASSVSFELPGYVSERTPKRPQEEQSLRSDKKEESKISLVIKDSPREETKAEDTPGKQSPNIITDLEREERQRFEEEKKAFEQRAERLRNMSFNYNKEKAEEIERIPAYKRQQIKLEKRNQNPQDIYLSGYSVEKREDEEAESVHIRTINTFLNGNKPD